MLLTEEPFITGKLGIEMDSTTTQVATYSDEIPTFPNRSDEYNEYLLRNTTITMSPGGKTKIFTVTGNFKYRTYHTECDDSSDDSSVGSKTDDSSFGWKTDDSSVGLKTSTYLTEEPFITGKLGIDDDWKKRELGSAAFMVYNNWDNDWKQQKLAEAVQELKDETDHCGDDFWCGVNPRNK